MLWVFENPVASSLIIKRKVCTRLNKINFKSSSPSDSLSNDEFFSKGIQPYKHEAAFSKVLVLFDGEHWLKEGTNGQKKLIKELGIQNCASVENSVSADKLKYLRV